MALSKNILANCLASLLLLTICCTRINAQKLSPVQNTGYFAPQNIKVDGKADDWGNQFQADNKHNHVEYTIANNQTYLYLVLQTTDKATINKIAQCGLSLVINTAKKQVSSALTITFPHHPPGSDSRLLGYTKSDADNKRERQLFFDSLMNLANYRIETTFKFIGITGTSLLADSSISVYNLDGIKAAARLDNKLVFTDELAIPLKYLKNHFLSDKFSYDIKFNGVDTDHKLAFMHMENNPRGDMILFEVGNRFYRLGMTNDPDIMFSAYSTDFWGEYNIVSK
jgi:hypothetical protein